MVPEAALSAFTEALDDAARIRTSSEAAGWLARAWSEARVAWPALSVDAVSFAAFVAARVRDAETLDDLRPADLYLACGCLARDAAAIAAFDRLLAEHAPVFRNLAGNDDVFDEAKQVTRQIILVGVAGAPALAGYLGRGDLIGWLKITLGREVARLVQRGKRHRQLESGELSRLIEPDDDPETAFLKAHYRDEFKQALTDAIGRLDDQERRLLRYGVVEHLTVDQVGVLLGMHRATAARHIARARRHLVEISHELLRTRLRVDTEHLHSIMRLVESQLDMSLHRLLA